jgi:hypothetical protein
MHAVACQNIISENILFDGPRAGFNFNGAAVVPTSFALVRLLIVLRFESQQT